MCTKKKFFVLLSNGLSIYKGSTMESVQDFLYMLRTSSMLEKTDTMEINYPELSDRFNQLKECDFKNISNEEYEELSYNISEMSTFIENAVNSNMMIQSVINDLLVILYTYQYSDDDIIVDTCRKIIKYTNLLFLNKNCDKSQSEIESMFVKLEGVQERLYPEISAADITDKIKDSYIKQISDLALEQEYHIVFKLPCLISDSIFIELDKASDNQEVDEEYINEQEKRLIDEYGNFFASNEKMINRAVMATVISQLPVFFNNVSQLQDFIFDTLSVCTDKAEKMACIEILNGIMSE